MPEAIELLHAEVLDHHEVAPDHWVITLDAPEIAAGARPGQFVMVRGIQGTDPLLPRALSIYHADVEGGCIELLYRVVGPGTTRLQEHEPGRRVAVWGPLGSQFRLPEGDRVVLVGGGVGVPPLVFWAERLAALSVPMEVIALIGAQSESSLVGIDRLRRARANVRIATDDGSQGRKGYVTDLLPQAVQSARATIYACGPTPMLKAVARLGKTLETPTELALEAPMACGVGACLGCTVPRREGGFARVCTEGPVFDRDSIDWETL